MMLQSARPTERNCCLMQDGCLRCQLFWLLHSLTLNLVCHVCSAGAYHALRQSEGQPSAYLPVLHHAAGCDTRGCCLRLEGLSGMHCALLTACCNFRMHVSPADFMEALRSSMSHAMGKSVHALHTAGSSVQAAGCCQQAHRAMLRIAQQSCTDSPQRGFTRHHAGKSNCPSSPAVLIGKLCKSISAQALRDTCRCAFQVAMSTTSAFSACQSYLSAE